MHCTMPVKTLLALLDATKAVAARKSPKPILEYLLLDCRADGTCVASATDLEVSVAVRSSGVRSLDPGRVLLPVAKIASVARTHNRGDAEVTIEAEAGAKSVVVRCGRNSYTLATEDPDLYPVLPACDWDGYHTLAGADLARLIDRTSFACDPESTRYALGGCKVEIEADADARTLRFVGTDGRRLATATAPAVASGTPHLRADGETPGAHLSPVIPLKALRVIAALARESETDVDLAFSSDLSGAFFRCDRATVSTRLVEGRYPAWRDAIPRGEPTAVLSGPVGDLIAALDLAGVCTSDEARGVAVELDGAGKLVVHAQSPDVGRAVVELPVNHVGTPTRALLDNKWMLPGFRVLREDEPASVSFRGRDQGVTVESEGFLFVIMPLIGESAARLPEVRQAEDAETKEVAA